MSTQHSVIAVDYPDSDGKPMEESDLHREWMSRIIDLLKLRYEDQQVYVTGNLLLYYVEGNPSYVVAPDAFVVKGIDPGKRRIYKLWEEGKSPNMVLETTSASTRKKDNHQKRELYALLGVGEYFQYDPTGDYLNPRIRGFRLTPGGYRRITPDSLGRLDCSELNLWLELDPNGDLVLRDRTTGHVLQTAAEAERTAREAVDRQLQLERQTQGQERTAREAVEAKCRELESELAALRAHLGNI